MMKRLFPHCSDGERQILSACFFSFFANGIFSLMLGSALPDIKAAYSLSDTQSGMMLSGHSMGVLVSGFLSGVVPLYLGRKKSAIALYAFAAIGFLMMIVWGNPLWLILGFIGTGVGRGSMTNLTNAEVNRISGGSPTALNLLHSSFAVGAILAPVIFVLFSHIGGWRLALTMVVLLLCTALFAFSRVAFADDRIDRGDKTQSTMCFLKDPSFLVLAIMMFFYLCAEYSVNGWLVTYLQNKPELESSFGVSGDALTAAIRTYSQSMATLLWGIMLVGRLLCAALTRRIPQKKYMLISSVAVAGFFSLLLFSGSVVTVTIAVAGLGFGFAGICPLIYSDASGITNKYQMATGTMLLIGSSGSVLMPGIVGATADRFGFMGGMSTILAAIVMLVVFSVLNLFVKPRLTDCESGKAEVQ